MRDELNKATFLTRRSFILGAAKAGLAAGLLGRMFYLQVLKNEGFSQLSERNRTKLNIIPPLRGRILDRDNKALVTNKKSHQLIFTRYDVHTIENIEKIALKISEILDFSEEKYDDLLSTLQDLKIYEYTVIYESLTWKQLVDIELHLFDLPGSEIESGFYRYYNYGALCGHLTGYIGVISSKETNKSSSLIYPNFKVGKNGIEKTQEALLHGVAGVEEVEVNAKGKIIREISSSRTIIPGQNIDLTIDIELQQKASNLLGDIAGVVLVAKAKTGEILASVSKPSFDPNLFTGGISKTNWGKLINNPELPLIDRSVALTYPPGSGFKVNVAIAALKTGFNPNTIFHCPGYHTVGDRIFRCWNRVGHGNINLNQAIAGSCNVYFWKVAKVIGVQPIADMARIMGYGTKLLNDSLPREQTGIIPDPEWKMKNIGNKWTLADTINTAIGQGYVEATPIQILTMVSRIATGREMMPYIIKDKQNIDNFVSMDLDREFNEVRKGMEMTTNSHRGTAYANRITIDKYAMAGKTGTCQVASKRHKDDDLSHAKVKKSIRNHGVFVAYAPLNNPEYSFCGIIEHGGSPRLAVKIAKELLTEAQVKKL
jgi:penicillin-binding protein 2